MATRIRTLKFLPEVFQTTTNAQFLGATLDQIVDQPNTMKIEGYIGSKFGYGIDAKDSYVVEPTKARTDYQLDPGVVFTKKNTSVASDFISYPGMIDAITYEGGISTNNDRLFNSQFYSWDPFVDLDKVINFNQYYWIPEGTPAVNISTGVVYSSTNYVVDDLPNGYSISSDINPTGTTNPTITMIRGGTYTFAVNQNSSFWIQGKPGLTGLDPEQPNLQTRNVLGVTNNGATYGTVTFNVPFKDAQSEYDFPGNIQIDVVSTFTYSQLNGQTLASIGGSIDGVTSLDGLTLMFYEAADPSAPSDVTATIYQISYSGSNSNIILNLNPVGSIPNNQKITILYGVQWKARNFYRNTQGTITLIPYISSLLDTLYYQDSLISDKVGIIKLIDSNSTNRIDVESEILGKANYTSPPTSSAPNGVVFTNGLKVSFSGDIIPTSYKSGEYYVQGVGTAITLIETTSLVVPQLFTEGSYTPYDVFAYDDGNYDSTLYVPVIQDYITIGRDSIDNNPWSRSNRWFHIDVINSTASYLNDPSIALRYATTANKAKRPIIEFNSNLKLFNNAIIGKQPVDFFDTRTTNAMTQVAGQTTYYPDVQVSTGYDATIFDSPTIFSGDFIEGQTYEITSVGTTDFTLLGASANTVGVTFVSTGTGVTTGGDFVVGKTYTILTVGNTDFIDIGASSNTVGETFVATGAGTGNGTAVQGNGTALALTYTFVEVPASSVTGAFSVGQYVADTDNVLPNNAQIIELSGTSTLLLTVSWTYTTTITQVTGVSLIANSISNDDYSLYDGARIIFSVDENPDIKNKIFITRLSLIEGNTTPVITLSEDKDGVVYADEGVFAFKGYTNQGKDFYFDGVNWKLSQQKTNINQPPLFDVVDADYISFGNPEVYVGTSFTGTKLFSYGVGSGINDLVLGFPLRYSSVNNVGDISFDVSFNDDTFSYVRGSTPITEKVNTGYVLNTSVNSGSISYSRQLGWQTAVAPSRQYQILSFNFVADNPTSTFICDVAVEENTVWPNIRLFVNNELQPSSSYSYTKTATTTTVTFTVPDPTIDTIIEIALLSDQVSKQGYYQVPINLSNNPFNTDITTVNVGDIRGQYQSIFYNNPNTTGQVFGANNFRDLGNLVPWGDKIIQNSASLVLPGSFLRQSGTNMIDAVQFNSQQYITFKNLLVNTVNNTDYTIHETPAQILDDALDQITSTKVDSGAFFWSDMLPSKAAYITNSYTFANSLDLSIYPLSKIYDFTKANYNGILVYLQRGNTITQLVINRDYTVSNDSPSLTVTTGLEPNDVVTIKEYNQTFGSFVPNTPTKLGLYPSWVPSVVLDSNYLTPTYFIVGHDGSYNKLYGEYIDGELVDFRDQVLFEFETRIYNNLKLANLIPIRDYDVIPGFFRTTKYSYEEILEIYTQFFLNWVGQNRIDYKTQVYISGNQFTYNYNQSTIQLDNETSLQGYWRGIYQYMYDTSQPDVAPWQMVGFTDQPTWWADRYGPAPYTSDNLVLWGDLAEGINWNNGDPVVIEAYVRPGLLNAIPVDSSGNLLSPLESVIGNYTSSTFKNNWKVGDVGPVEFSYRRSSSWPFDLMKILSLTEPANFYNLGVDVDNYKYSAEFNQFLVNNRSHLVVSDIEIYGSGVAKTSYINWLVDYEKQYGVDATTSITTLLDNLDVRLIYRLAGFSDKSLLNFYVEKGTPNSKNASLLIPNESYSVLLYNNIPFTKIVFSSVIVQSTPTGWKVFGNSQANAYFTTLKPKINGNYSTVDVEKVAVQVANDYTDVAVVVPYGTEFTTAQELSQFLMSYGEYLISQGALFEQIESGLEVTWKQMIAEFLYWIQSGWEVGSIINLNPGANLITINKDSYVVQPLTLQKQNFVLNQNLYPIQAVDLSVVRDGTLFSAKPLNEGDTVAYGQFNISNFEHGVVFDNVTLFNDVIYNLITGLRQNRITCRGVKTAEWNGTIDAQGFILNQDNIQEWNTTTKYTKGSIVLFKNKYWVALKVIDPAAVFDPTLWKETSYNEIQKGLLPNSSTRSYESSLYYDTNQSNLDKDADLLSWSLIGYRPRDYLALADLTDITQVNVYKNMVKTKGTRLAANAFKGLSLPQGGIDYDIYENWAIKTGDFGGVLNQNYVDFKLDQSLLTGNPAIVGLTDGDFTSGVEQEVLLYSLFNYGRPITNPNVLPTLPTNTPNVLFPDAGYVNFDDIKVYSYYFDGLNSAVTPITSLYVGEFVWLADYKGTWQVYTPVSLGSVVSVVNNLNGTATIQFAQPHNLTQYEPFAIVNFNVNVDGYRIVASIIDSYRVSVILTLPTTINTITGLGIGFSFVSQRVSSPNKISNLNLLDSEFVGSKVWVDENTDGAWAVLKKNINYTYNNSIVRDDGETFGSAVAYTDLLGYLVSDADAGKIYRYVYNYVFKRYDLSQTLTGGASFGTTITYVDNTFIISNPTGVKEVYVYQLINDALQNELVLVQTISQTDIGTSGITNFGQSTALSDDKNWLYISAHEQNLVFAFRKSQVSGEYVYSKTITSSSVNAGDSFGYALTTNYFGNTVFVGAPNTASTLSVSNYGAGYVFDRLVQTYEAIFTSSPYVPITFTLVAPPEVTEITVTEAVAATDVLTVSSTDGLQEGANGTPIVFSGTVFGGVAINSVYYVKEIVSPTTITISTIRDGSVFGLTDGTGSMTCNAQTEEIYVSVNGTLISDNSYSVVGSMLYVYGIITIGSVIQVSGSYFVQTQVLQPNAPANTQCKFGFSTDFDTNGNELLIGSPLEVTNDTEGYVYRYTNSGGKYGSITAYAPTSITASTTILINGHPVVIEAGDSTSVANNINSASIGNITASVLNGLLTIRVTNTSVAYANDMLHISVLDPNVWIELGMKEFTNTQTIPCPHYETRTQFGYSVKFNSTGSFVASAPVATRFTDTTFDMTDDINYTNDTLFDNNATQFIDSYTNAGAIYMFDYLGVYQESIINSGSFVFSQSLNSNDIEYGAQPYYGTAIDFSGNTVVVGTPNYMPLTIGGQVTVFYNSTGTSDWSVYRTSSPVVDISKIQNTQIYGASTYNTFENLDYIDPLQGKILGVVRQNIDVVSNTDPASYNSPTTLTTGKIIWGTLQVGKLWFNTSATKFVNYHQSNDVVYNSKWWGKVFPGSDVQVYSWVTSDVPPVSYAGPGTPYNVDDYVIEYKLNSTGSIVPVYFYWVRNTNIIFTKAGKTLSDTICESYIVQPQATGIAYMAPVQPNVFSLFNCGEYIAQTDAVFHIGYSNGTHDDDSHSVYSLIRANYADDFLPGLPGSAGVLVPESLYSRMIESLSGVDASGNVVPDPALPKPVQSGILVRPRQSFFYNRFNALKNYLEFANQLLATIPAIETIDATFLYKVGAINPSTVNNPNWGGPEEVFFDTSNYWEPINWWATGYSNSTKSSLLVQSYYDLAFVTPYEGQIVTVNKNGAGVQETYVYESGEWIRVGLQYGTLQFKSSLWDYADNGIGYGNNFFDTEPFDTYPSEETKYIVRTINEQLPQDMLIYRNQALILLFQYIMSETIESQNYLPWLNKTSFVDVTHKIRELLPLKVFQSDNQEFLEGYLNEIKPYHVVIKDFLFEYVGSDVYESNVTDFDVPAIFNSSYQQYISPELVYSSPSAINQYLPENPIWQNSNYVQWFDNFGLSLTGSSEFYLANLESFVALNSNEMLVSSVYGFPINGVVTIGTEQIGYSSVDIASNTISGLTRGVNGTSVENHIPGEKIFMNLSPVVVLDSGRGYSEPPKVIAYIDTDKYPAPRRAASLQPVMNLDSLLRIDVIDPGEGYVVTPEIRIDPSIVLTFESVNVTLLDDTISIANQLLQTGDLVQYTVGTDTTPIGGLDVGQYYYVSVLQTSPVYVIAFYTTYADAIKDMNRVTFFNAGSGDNHIISVNARAIAITSSTPIRENQITIRFDRTTYQSRVVDWEPAGYYGSFFAGLYNNSTQISSSAIKLMSTGNESQAPITNVLASSQGVSFEIQSVRNDQVITWSSRTRVALETFASNNSMKIEQSPGGMIETGVLGPTTGFYPTMPIRFEGGVFGGLQLGVDYFVAYVFDLSSFAISTDDATTDVTALTIGQKYIIDNVGNTDWTLVGAVSNTVGLEFTATGTGTGTGTAYRIVTLSNATAPSSGINLIIGEVLNTAIVTINYPNILTVTATTSGTNAVTIPLTLSGMGGTTAFYRGLPVFFVGNVFGGILANEIYYVTSILDKQRFTMSVKNDPVTVTVFSADDTTNYLYVDLTDSLQVNDPFVISDIVINGAVETSFGGLNEGTIYYVQSIISATAITVTTSINGSVMPLTLVSAASDTAALLVDQRDTLDLTTASGSMTINVGLPVSPGQISGQYFTLYQTSGEYADGTTGIEGTTSNLLTRTTIAIADDRLYLTTLSGGITDFYVNMPFELSGPIGSLVAATSYEINSLGYTSQTITTINGSNQFEVTSTTGFFADMKVEFSGAIFGGVEASYTYYVVAGFTSTAFSVSQTPGGSVFTVSASTGEMTVTSVDPYIVPNTTSSDDVATVTLTQTPTGANPRFFVGYVLGGYTVQVDSNYPGTGFAYNNLITIQGSLIGGVDGVNDLSISVDTISSTGEIETVIVSGKPAGTANGYYLKVISETELAVFTNSLMTVPASGIDFPYTGVTSTTVTELDGTDIYVDDPSKFAVNDIVVFTGEVEGNIVLGETYYVRNVYSTRIKISSSVQGTAFNAGSVNPVSFTMAKYGDFAFLAEPFYFQQSIVKYQNKVWQCVVSNNDNDFILGKWQLLSSDDRILNELDRIVGYYQPTVNMPGLDIAQLVYGVTYPNSTYRDNAFPPADEFEYDTYLQDQVFYPQGINIQSVTWNGSLYLAIGNSSEYSALLFSPDDLTWNLQQIADTPINVTDIQYGANLFVITAFNSATPVFVSPDGVNWTAGANVHIPGNLVYAPTKGLNSVTYGFNEWIAVGTNIISSPDGYNWTETKAEVSNQTLISVSVFSINNFYGFVAVGKHIAATAYAVVYVSVVSGVWNSVDINFNSTGFNGVTSGNNLIVVVGDNGTIYTSPNGSNWTERVSGITANLYDCAYGQGKFIAVGDAGTILVSVDDGVTWTDESYSTTETFNGITYDYTNNDFVIVGDNNITLESVDGYTWEPALVLPQLPTTYTVQGDEFTAGYGPEELVPGVISDNLIMTVTTRPGNNWDIAEYGHSGFSVNSTEITPTTGQLVYSFANVSTNPVQVAVFIADSTTKLSTRYIDYTVNWIDKTVTLASAPVNAIVRIDCYEVGNGDQLDRSNSEATPFVQNIETGFTEMALNCFYTASITSGSGVIRPPQPTTILVTNSYASDNTFYCPEGTTGFVLNSPIVFSGTVFGGVTAGTTYYVKTADYLTNLISISDSLTSEGVAGATFALSTDSGGMDIEIQVGSGLVWTQPYVAHNGDFLVMGQYIIVGATTSGTNLISCDVTSGIAVGDNVTFDDNIFGGISAHTPYTVLSVYSDTEFTIEDPGNPGNPLTLTDGQGASVAITKDYSIGQVTGSTSAKIVFAEIYSPSTDYVSYAVLGETSPTQIGYSSPATQVIVSDGSLVYSLVNYVGGDNPLNSIVEVNGERKLPVTDYTIDAQANTITLVSSVAGDVVTITTYNLTDNQYLTTTTQTDVECDSIISISNAISAPVATTQITTNTSTGNIITAVNTSNFLLNATVQFYGTSNFGNLDVTTGTVYFIKTIDSSTEFTISLTPGGAAFDPGHAVGTAIAVVGGQPAVRVTTTNTNTFSTNDVIRISGTSGSVQLNNNAYYIHVISDTQFDLYLTQYDPSVFASNSPITTITAYSGGGFAWLDQSIIVHSLYAFETASNVILTSTDSSGTNPSTNGLIEGTPVYFNGTGYVTGDVTPSNIVIGTEYYIHTITGGIGFTITDTRGGDVFTLTNDTFTLKVSQWQQTDVDRLWVTVNGERVLSSALVLNGNNDLGILTEIVPGDIIEITSMIPTSTPEQTTYLQVVNKSEIQAVYRANQSLTTWLTVPLQYTSPTVHLNDVSKVTSREIINIASAPAPVNGSIVIGLPVDKNSISQVIVYNNNTQVQLPASSYTVTVENIAPVVKITSGVSTGDGLTITVVLGNLIYVGGEMIRFTQVDFTTNTLSGLQRGVNGTPVRTLIGLDARVYGVSTSNLLQYEYYDQTWNSYVYNPVEGDPLQISNTPAANFLNSVSS